MWHMQWSAQNKLLSLLLLRSLKALIIQLCVAKASLAITTGIGDYNDV